MKSKKRNGVSRNQEAPPIYKQPNREPEKLLTLFDKSANDPQEGHSQKRCKRIAEVVQGESEWTRLD